MSSEYKKVIIAVLVLVLVIGAGIFVYNYIQKPKLGPEIKELFSLPEGAKLTEEQQMKYEAARTALEENPQDPLAMIAIAQLKYQVQDLDGAIDAYLMALEIQPTNTLILNNLGDIYNQKKEYEKASEMYLKITQTNPKWINTYYQLLEIYKYHLPARYPEIEQILLRGLERIKELEGEAPVDFYSLLAVFYDETGQIEKAIENYQKVIELTPQNESAKTRLEELREL